MAKRRLSDLGDAPEQTVRRTRSQKHKPQQEQEQAASDAAVPAALPSNMVPNTAEDAPKKQQSLSPHAAFGAGCAPGGAEPLHQPGPKPCQPVAGSPAAGTTPPSPVLAAAQSPNGSSSSTASAAGPAVVASGVFADDAEREAEDSRCLLYFACTVLLRRAGTSAKAPAAIT